jgi:PAS domain S-box-containing protein
MTRGQKFADAGSSPPLDEADAIPGKKAVGTLLLKTFGSLRFKDHRGRELRAPTRKTAALAAYLAMRPDKRVAREAIACLLWGDKKETHARHSLSQAISDVRHVFGEQIICVDSQFLWSPGDAAEVDALRLVDLSRGRCATEGLEAVESLYDGDFLQGFDLGQEDFDCWVLAERERLRHLAHSAMTELLAIKIRASQYDSALRTAQKILSIEPFDETAHRAIMRCYARQGFPRRAIDHFNALEADIRRELGVEPALPTLDVYREIVRGSTPPNQGRTLSEYSFVLEQLPYAVAVTDTVNRIVGWNRIAEETFGFSKAEMVGRSPTLVYAPDHDSSLADQILRKAIAGGRWSGDVTLIAKDGSTRRQRRVVAPLFGPEGEIVGAFGHGFPV